MAYKGKKDAVKIVTEGLKNLEYRGHDSWGIAAIDQAEGEKKDGCE